MSEIKKAEEELSSDDQFEKMWKRISPPEWSADTEPIMQKGLAELDRKAEFKAAIFDFAAIACFIIFIAAMIAWACCE